MQAQAVGGKAPAAAPAHAGAILLTTILASSLSFVDGSVVNVGLPAIGSSLGSEARYLPWVVNGYLLPLGALLLLGGALGDRFGRRRLLVIGTVLFAVASAACAAAPNLPWLVLARGVQGVGAALLMPNSLAILGASFSGEARGRAIGTWAAAGAMTAAVGPVLGGVLIDGAGWPWIFLINLPLAAAAVWLAWRYVPADGGTGAEAPLDLAGAALATLALGGLTTGITLGSAQEGWTASAQLCTAAGAVLLACFLAWEKRMRSAAMMPLALFGSPAFVALSALTLLLYGALGGLFVLLPYLLIEGLDYSATRAGAALLPLPIILTITSPVMGALAGRFGPRWPLALGPLVTAFGFLLLLRIDAGSGYWTTVLPPMLVIALGMAGAVAPLTTAVLGSVDARHSGSASGLNSALARVGGLVATALLGAVLGASGATLISGFQYAALVGAAASAAAGLCALLMIPSPEPSEAGVG